MVEDVEILYLVDAVGLLVSVKVENVKTVCVKDVTERLDNAQVEEGAVELLVGVEIECVAALQLEAFGLETLEFAEATQAFELVLGSYGRSPGLDSAFSLEGSYSFRG